MVGLISFQPIKQNITNYLSEKNRLEQETFINQLIEDNKVNYDSMRAKLSRTQRPDLRGVHEYIMTHDPNTNSIPRERLLNAMQIAEAKKSSFAYSMRMTEINWEERGPNNIGGRTRALLIDPSNSNKLWAAGVSGGLWYTNDITAANPNWNLVDGTWASLSVCSIDYDPNNTSTMYVGTGERMGNHNGSLYPGDSKGLGMWKSTDSGASWTHLPSTTDFNYVNDIIVRNENGSSVIYIAVGGQYYEGQWIGYDQAGIWKSTDGGTSWSRAIDRETSSGYEEFMDLDLGSDNRIWAGTRFNVYNEGGGTIFYSDDGTTWTSANWKGEIVTTSANRVLLSVAPSDPNTVYALIEQDSTGKVGWIVKTTDGGSSWTQLTIPLDANGGVLGDTRDFGQAGYDLSLRVDPNDPNVVFAGEIDVFKTIDGGSSWTQISGGDASTADMHVDQHNIKFIDSNRIIFSNDGGVHYSSNGGLQIDDRNSGYNVGQFYAIALHPSSKYVLGGTQDNGSWSVAGSGTSPLDGTYISGGDGAFAHIDQSNPNYQFTSSQYNTVYRSIDGGSSFSTFIDYEVNGLDTGLFINPSVIDPNTKTFYSSIDETSILRKVDYTVIGGGQPISINLGSTATAYKVSPHTNDLLFVGTGAGRVFKIENASTGNYTVTEISGSNVSGYISSIDIGVDDNQILISVSNYGVESLFETMGGGGSNGWINIEGDLPDMPIRWALYNKNNFNQTVVATELGTWISDDISASSPVWYPSNDGLAKVRVDMLAKNSNGELAAGTYGRGMFYSTGFTSTAPLNAAFTPDKTAGVFPLTVQFTDRSTGSITSWAWDFGDGSTSADQSPSHTYATAGQFNVSLSVGDGTNSDSVTKNNVIWATAEQDTLWEEGFETNPYGWADGRRDVHAFSSINSNNDSDDFSWWYYTAGYGAADGSHWMAGLGYAGAGSADDWLISPKLWLRPGTDNILSFYTNMNGGAEDYDVLLSPSGGTSIEDFTVTLANIVAENTGSWTQQSYDLTAYAGTDVRVAIHVTTSNQQYAFWDNFTVTAGQLSSDGAPLAPQGVSAEPELVYDAANDVWNPSDDGVAIFWNRNGESDFASYNVYGSLTDNFTPDSSNLLGQGTLGNIDSEHFYASPSTTPWPDTTFVFRQTFGVDSLLHDGLTQGEKWYYKVGAVDNDGNENISDQVSYILDSTGPTVGTFTINDLENSEYLRSTSDITISVDGWSDNVGIAYYYMGIGTTDQDLEADVVFYQNVGLTNLTLTGLTLDDYTKYYLKVAAFDESGNNSDAIISGFTTYTSMLGDYDNDWDVDVEDLNSLVNAWPNVDIGPATGTSPYLTPTLDSTCDVYDISVFTRNWQWTKAQGKTSEPGEEQKLNPIDFPAELFGNQIKITLPDDITAGRFEIVNEGNVYQFSVAKNNQSMIILENNDNLEESYEFEFGRLSQDEKELFIYIDGDAPRSTVEISYQLFSKDGAAGNGIMELGTPDEFKLYQNYPNPFSNQTTLQYDVAEATSVKIYIYNTLGQLVKTIDQGENGVGTYTVEWDGKNDDGDTLSSGVYFYQLRTKDFNKTMKMLLVK